MSAAVDTATWFVPPGGAARERILATHAELELRERLSLAARVALGLEPGVLLRLRALRPQELIFQGTSEGDVRIALDFDHRALPRLGTEHLLPVDPFTVPARVWADALAMAAAALPRPAVGPPAQTRRRAARSGR